MNQMPPVFFPGQFRGLVMGEQKFLFAKAEEMFQVAAVSIGLIDISQG